MSGEEGHRLDGFDPDSALDEIRALVYERSDDDRLAHLFDLLDHWLVVGERLPDEWARPDPHVMAERLMAKRHQPKRTTRAERRGR